MELALLIISCSGRTPLVTSNPMDLKEPEDMLRVFSSLDGYCSTTGTGRRRQSHCAVRRQHKWRGNLSTHARKYEHRDELENQFFRDTRRLPVILPRSLYIMPRVDLPLTSIFHPLVTSRSSKGLRKHIIIDSIFITQHSPSVTSSAQNAENEHNKLCLRPSWGSARRRLLQTQIYVQKLACGQRTFRLDRNTPPYD